MPMNIGHDSDCYYEAPVCYLNLLTLYIGVISIRYTSSGQRALKGGLDEASAVIGFYPKHATK